MPNKQQKDEMSKNAIKRNTELQKEAKCQHYFEEMAENIILSRFVYCEGEIHNAET